MQLRVQIYVILLMISIGCNNNYNDIEIGWWKYGDGYHIGDALRFDDFYNVSNDTIFRNKKAIATIQFYTNRRMTIKSLNTGEKGIYHHK